MRSVKLGLFIVVGAILLTFLIFKMGSKSRLFEGRKKIVVKFENTQGIKNGNDVRFSGVNVGAVHEIEIENDSIVRVVLSIDSKAAEFIKKDSKATISSEGLVGAKFVGISAGSENSSKIEDGDSIKSGKSFEVDELLKSISKAGENASKITDRIDSMANSIAMGNGVLGALLADTMLQKKVESIAYSLDETGKKTNLMAQDLMTVPDQINKITTKVQQVTDTLQVTSSNSVRISDNIQEFSKGLNSDSTTIGKIVGDTAMAKNIDHTIDQVNTTAEDVEATSSKVRNNIFIRLFSSGKEKNKDELN
jgi:phospholipid/cholesterol/gamma-HCH transport system substrate-binding protein